MWLNELAQAIAPRIEAATLVFEAVHHFIVSRTH